MGSGRKTIAAASLGATAVFAALSAGTAWADGTPPPAASGGQSQATTSSGGAAGGTAADGTPAASNAGAGQAGQGGATGNSQGAQSGNPPGSAPYGSNGTIKVEELTGGMNTTDAGPDNDPQLTCGVAVNFFGFDAGTNTAQLTFTAQAPSTGTGKVQRSTQWTALRTGGDTFDKTYPVPDLAGALHSAGVGAVSNGAKAGSYHVKVTAVVTGPNQRLTTKTKVFWLQPCGPLAGASAQQLSSTGGTAGTSVQGLSLTRSGGASPKAVSASSTGSKASGRTPAAAGPATAVLGESLHRGALPFSLPFTGFSALGALAWGAGLLGAGSGAVALSRRRRTPTAAAPVTTE